MSTVRLVARAILLTSAVLCCLIASMSVAQADGRLWTVELPAGQSLDSSNISLSPLGDIELRAGDSLSIVDPKTGTTTVKPTKAPTITAGNTPFALEWDGDELVCIDTGKAAVAWRTSSATPGHGPKGLYGFIPVPDQGLVLLFGATNAQPIETVAVALDSGDRIWSTQELFPGAEGPKRDERPDLGSYHPPIVANGALVLFLSSAGPVALGLATGELRWRSSQDKGSVFGSAMDRGYFGSPDWYRNGTPPMFASDGILVVPSGSALYGIDIDTGEKTFATSKIGGFMPKKRYKTTIRKIWTTDYGLLVYGYDSRDGQQATPWLDVVDPQTGKYAFKKPTPIFKKTLTDRALNKNTSTGHGLEISGKSAFAYGSGKLERLDLKKGKMKRLDRPRGRIQRLDVLPEGVFVRGNNWAALLDPEKGKEIYHRSFEAPESGYWDQMLDGAVAIGETYLKQQMAAGFAKATAGSDDAIQNAAAAEVYRQQSSKDLDERLAKIGNAGAVAAADDETFTYFFAGDGKPGSKARDIHKVRKADGETVSVTPIDTEAMTVNFVVDAGRQIYYVNDGSSIFAQAIASGS